MVQGNNANTIKNINANIIIEVKLVKKLFNIVLNQFLTIISEKYTILIKIDINAISNFIIYCIFVKFYDDCLCWPCCGFWMMFAWTNCGEVWIFYLLDLDFLVEFFSTFFNIYETICEGYDCCIIVDVYLLLRL